MNFLGGANLHVSQLTGQLIVYYTESCSTTLYSAECCAVRHDRETRRLGGKHDDLFSLHVTSLIQSYFCIRHINYMRYNKTFHVSFKRSCEVRYFRHVFTCKSCLFATFLTLCKRIGTKQNRSTEGCSNLKRSVDMTSSGKNGLNIRTNASPKWDRTRCPEE